MQLDLMAKRDVMNFMTWRDARAEDDYRLTQFLLTTFSVTTALKRPELDTTAERVHELCDVASRRKGGVVRLLEMGHRIVGTYALMRPGDAECLAWVPGCAYLRAVAIDHQFQGIKLSDSLLNDSLQVAEAWDVPGICLHVVRGSSGLVRLYQRHGYVADTRGDQPGKGYDLDGFTLTLAAKKVTA